MFKILLNRLRASGNVFILRNIPFCLLFFFLTNFYSGVLFAQDEKPPKVFTSTKNPRAFDAYNTSSKYLEENKYKEVEILCKNALKFDSEYVDAYVRLSYIYEISGKTDLQEKMIQAVIKIRPEFSSVYYKYAELLMNNKRYDSAIVNFNHFLSFGNLPEKFVKKAYWNIELCKFRDNAYKNPVPYKPENLGDGVNSALDEYWPVLTADEQTLYFTRRMKLDTNKQFSRFNFNEDVYVSTFEVDKWGKAISIPGFLNSPNLNEGAISITPDGKTMYFAICSERDDVGFGSCDIYTSENKNGKWSAPKNLGPVINTSHKETQPSISFNGKTLYFASDREGTFGKLDIWKTVKDDNGNWTPPVNLGKEINTEGNEQSPFIHSDDKTLFFSTDKKIGMGGSDLYVAKKDAKGNFYNVKNLGYPINTENEELSLFVSASGKKAYFASNVSGKGYGGLDIYSFDLPPALRPDPVCYLKGVVYDSMTKAKLSARFELVNVETGQTVLVSNAEDISGKFLEAVPSDANYMLNVSKKGYLFYSAHLPIKGIKSSAYIKDIAMQPIMVGQTIILNNIFFEFDSFSLKNESVAELKKMTGFLNEYPNVKVEISGHTDAKGSEMYNQVLSENRARRVYEYLVTVGKIDKNRLTYKGYGKSRPVDTNATDEGRAHNRRTEFKITGL